MSKNALSDIFRRWVARGRRGMTAPVTTPARRAARLGFETFEDRLVPATLSTPTVAAPTPLTGGFSPQTAVDPNNPLHIVTVAASGNKVVGQYSLDGGASWSAFTAASTVGPGVNFPFSLEPSTADPLLNPAGADAYTNVSSPGVAFSPNGNVFVTFLETNLPAAGGVVATSGAVGVTSFSFDPVKGPQALDPVAGTVFPHVVQVYQWVNQDPAYNPTIAVDTNVATDPATGAPLPADSMLGTAPQTRTKTVYVAWNTAATRPAEPVGIFNPNIIEAVASDDEAATFTSPVVVSNGGYFSPSIDSTGAVIGAAAPQILFTPNTTNPNTLQPPGAGVLAPSTVPGTLTFVWQQAGGGLVTQNTSLPDGGTATQEAAAGADFTNNTRTDITQGQTAAPPAVHPNLPNPAPNSVNLYPTISTNDPNPPAFNFGDTITINVNNQKGALDLSDATGVQVTFTLPANFVLNPNPPVSAGWVIVQNGLSYVATFQPTTSPFPLNNGGSLPGIPLHGTYTGPTGYFEVSAVITAGATQPSNNQDQQVYSVGSPPKTITVPTTSTLPVSFAGYPLINPTDPVTDLTVSLAIVDPTVKDLLIQLVSPSGQTITLVENNVDANGKARPGGPGFTTGLPNANNLGALVYGQPYPLYALTDGGVGTVFDDNAPRQINDTASVAPYIGHYQPEDQSLSTLYSGLTAADMAGNWTLVITDFENHGNTPPPQFLASWDVHFSFDIQNDPVSGFSATTNAATGVTTNGSELAVASATPVSGAAAQTYPLAGAAVTPVSPVFGIGPGVSVAYDPGHGASPYAGREYMVYTANAGGVPGTALANTDIQLIYSDDNGKTWSLPITVNTDSSADNTSEGNRAQFMPTVTVDPVTGTVVVMWYDARNDASDGRAATYMATSIDGGQTFGANVFLNSPKQAINALDPAQTVNLEPIPSTLVNSGPYQFGTRQAAVAYDGKIVTFWTGNAPYTDENGNPHSNNGSGTTVYSNVVTIAAGPRVLAGDSGPVTTQAVITDGYGAPTTVTDSAGKTFGTYNDTFAPDGTRQLTGFRVVFDRPVSISSFTAGEVRVSYQDPSTGQTVLIPVGTPIPIYPVGLGAAGGTYFDPNGGGNFYYFPAGTTNAFFVPFTTPQSAVGTYSYSIGPAAGAAPGTSTGVTDLTDSASPAWAATDVPLTIPPFNGTTQTSSTTTSTVTVAGVPAGTVLGNVAVQVSIKAIQDALGNSLSDGSLTLALVGPDGTRVVLSDKETGQIPQGPPNFVPAGFTLTTFDNNAGPLISAGTAPFTGRFRPDSIDPLNPTTTGLAAFIVNGTPINGQWTLEVDNASGQQGVVTGWALILTDPNGAPIVDRVAGNQMDQNADGVAGEYVPGAAGARADAFSNPAPTSPTGVTVPFTGPYASTSVPLVIPGPQVVSTSVVVGPVGGQSTTTTSQPVTVSSVVPVPGTNTLTVTLNRPIDPASFSLADASAALGPFGPVTVAGVTPVYSAWAPVLVAGTTSVNVTFTDPPGVFSAGDVLSLTGPTGSLYPLTNLLVTPTPDATTYNIEFIDPLTAGLPTPLPAPLAAGGQYTFTFRPGLQVTHPGETAGTPTATFAVTLGDPVISGVAPQLVKGATSYTVTFATPPVSFTAADVTTVTDPFGTAVTGPFTVTQVSPTQYTIGFPALAIGGQYKFTFDSAVAPLAAGDTSARVTFATPPAVPFTAADVAAMTGPAGPISGPFTVTQLSATEYQIGFPAVAAAGTYAFTFTPATTVAVAAGDTTATVTLANPPVLLSAADLTAVLDPNGNPVAGPFTVTQSSTDPATFTIGFPAPAATAGTYTFLFDSAAATLPAGTTSYTVAFANAPAVFNANMIESVVGPAGPVAGPFTVTQVDATHYTIGFPAPLAATGRYLFTFFPTTAGTVSDKGTFADLTFANPPATFTPAAIRVVTDSKGKAVAGPFTVTQLTGTTYRVGFPKAPGDGTYDFTIDTRPPAVNGSYAVGIAPTARPADGQALNGDVGAIDVTFDRDISPASFTPSNVLGITGPAGAVQLSQTPAVVTLPLGATATTITFTNAPPVFTAADITTVTDPNGNPVAGPFTVTALSPTQYTIGLPFTVTLTGQYTFTFDSAVATLAAGATSTTITLAAPPAAPLTGADVAGMTGPNGPVAGPFTLTQLSPTLYRVGFPALTTPGQYTINLYPVVAGTVSGGANYADVTFTNAPASLTAADIKLVTDANGNPVPGPFTVGPPSEAIVSASQAASVVTITTATAENFQPGQVVVIAGVGENGYNGTFTIASVLSSTQFTYITATTGLPGSSGGTATQKSASNTYRVTFPTAPGDGTYYFTIVPTAPVTVTPVGTANPLTGGYRTFQVSFPVQTVSGAYSVQLGSNPANSNPALASIRSADLPQLTPVLGASNLPTLTTQLAKGAVATQVTFSPGSLGGSTPPTLPVGDIQSITDPNGNTISAAGVTITQVSGTTYKINFPAGRIALAGSYVIQFTPASGLLVASPTSVTVTFAPGSFAGAPPASLPASDIQGITDPNGNPVSTAGVTLTQVGTGTTTYQLTFPTGLDVGGKYAIRFTTGSKLLVAGAGVDTNTNAGVAELRGIDPNATVTTKSYATGAAASVSITPTQTTAMAINVPDNFIIQPGQTAAQQIQVLLNINFPYDPDLVIDLVAPDGTAVRLFTGSGVQNLSNQANFSNTLLEDSARTTGNQTTTPITQAAPPYNPQGGAFNPQLPLSVLAGKNARGTWTLQVTNRGSNTGTIVNWTLTLPQAAAGSGLGEPVADRISTGFTIFNMNPSSATSQQQWTPVGGSSNNQHNAGQVSQITVDPSDPSGNTVYAAGASGGVWKTTNFLTTDPAGPNWVPLTDFGPTTSLNVGSIAVYPRNNDPGQSVILVGTGQGGANTFGSGGTNGTTGANPAADNSGAGSPGVGFLLSTDGGKTWQVLDSKTNVDSNGAILPLQDPGRDHEFVGTSVFKVLIDPNPTQSGQLIFYAAVSPSQNPGPAGAAAGGVWRSNDTGQTWHLVQGGAATDITLAAGSATSGSSKNLQVLYAGFSGANGGVYYTPSATSAASMTKLTGGQGNSLFLSLDFTSSIPVPISNPVSSPGSVPVGRVALAAPALTSSPLLNATYQGWLYALVTSANGQLAGLYMTKDFGRNWTLIQMPEVQTPTGQLFGTNNTTRASFQTSGLFLEANGNLSMALAVDPLNPNIVYVGGSNHGFNLADSGSTGLLRVDTTKLEDTQALVAYNNTLPGGITPQFNTTPGAQDTTGSVAVEPNGAPFGAGVPYGLVPTGFGSAEQPMTNTGYLNLFRDPADPFNANATLYFQNVARFQNLGTGAVVEPFTAAELGTNVHSIVPFIDPVTGQVRLLVGDDQGISTVLDTGVTSALGTGAGTDVANVLTSRPGFVSNPSQSRNGNLQVSQFYSGSAQPSQLAADVAGAMFYGMSYDNGFQASAADVLQTGNTSWANGADGQQYQTIQGYGNGVATDQTGSGTAYEFRAPNFSTYDGINQSYGPTDFLRVITNTAANPAGVGRTSGLLQNGDQPQNGLGQWVNTVASTIAVNPIAPDGILVSATGFNGGTGRLFRTTDQGLNWFAIGEPGTAPAFGTTGPALDGTYADALAFGAPSVADQKAGILDNFVYVGSSGGTVLMSQTGGAPWLNITGPTGGSFGSAGSLDGSPVMAISPDPRPGTTDVFVVTQKGVYYKADATNGNAPWVNITGPLFQIQNGVFGNGADPQNTLAFLTSLAVDWRYQIPGNTLAGQPGTYPVLYVAGAGGVYRSLDFGTNWALYPAGTTYTDQAGNTVTTPDGGYLPNAMVTKLSLSLGNINPSSGLPDQANGPNMLVATTWGRGTYAIRLGNAVTDPAAQTQAPSGPQVVSLSNPNPTGGPSSAIQVKFSGSVDPATFTPDTVQLVGPTGTTIPVTSVTEIPDPNGQGADQQDLYQLNFAPQSAVGAYTLTVGYNPNGSGVPTITDLGGDPMNQNGNTLNGEAVVDQYHNSITLNGTTNNRLFVTSFPGTVVAGTTSTITVQARDANDALLPENGTLTVSGPGFTAFQVTMTGGTASFPVTLTKAGADQVGVTFAPTAPDTTQVNGTSWTTTVTAAAPSQFAFDKTVYPVTAPGAQTFTITAEDQYGNPTSYTGQVTIASAGVAATLPADPVDMANGVATFSGEFDTSGTVTITASAPNLVTPGGPALTGTATVSVLGGVATHLTVTPAAGPYAVGTPVTVTVRALDANGNLSPSLDGQTATIGLVPDNGSTTVSPPAPVFSNGVATLTVTFTETGTYTVTAAAGGVSGSSGPLSVASGVVPTPVVTPLPGTFAVGTGPGGSPVLQVFNPDGSSKFTVTPFPAGYDGLVDPTSVGFTGGLRVAVGDVTGDGVPDYVVGSGPGIVASVVVIDGKTGQTILDYKPFETFTGGVFVAVGDIRKQGYDDIVITPDQGGGPRVEILSGKNFARYQNFMGIDDPNFRGGARAAVGDVNGDGYADLVISAGFGGGPRISYYDGAHLARGVLYHPIGDFFAFEPALRNGAYVAVGDVNGDGYGDLIFGAGPGGGPRVLVLSGQTLLSTSVAAALAAPVANFFAGDLNNRGGIRVAAKDLNGDANADVVTGAGEGGGSGVTAYSGALLTQNDYLDPLLSFDAQPGYLGGVFVG